MGQFNLFENKENIKATYPQDVKPPAIEDGWKTALSAEFQADYFKTLKAFLTAEIKAKKVIYPHPKNIFKAFNQCAFDNTKVVLLGQDPYHGPGQANGLSFSVNKGVRIPPSLQNIYKEIHDDLGYPIPTHGNLEYWANQGVLCLNATLTVAHKKPTSHSGQGWEIFTDNVIKILSDKKENVVFLLWGSFARSKKTLIDPQKHHILEAPHPSPFSAHSGFFGCKHFSQTNQLLTQNNLTPIDWQNP